MYCVHLIYVACICLNPNRTSTPMILMYTGMILLDLTLQNDWSKRLLCIQLRYVIIEVHGDSGNLPSLRTSDLIIGATSFDILGQLVST